MHRTATAVLFAALAIATLAMATLAMATFAATPVQAAGCRVTPISLMYGIDSQSHMDITSGSSCSIRFGGSPRGRTYSAGGGSNLAVSAQAQHGQVMLVGPMEVAYRSAPGYVGPDQFTFETTGEVLPVRGPPRRGTAHVVVDVSVVR